MPQNSKPEDLEQGRHHAEEELLLAERHTSSQDQELTARPADHALTTLHVISSKPGSDELNTEHALRLRGVGLAALSTVFQAVMSVCAKSLGNGC